MIFFYHFTVSQHSTTPKYVSFRFFRFILTFAPHLFPSPTKTVSFSYFSISSVARNPFKAKGVLCLFFITRVFVCVHHRLLYRTPHTDPFPHLLNPDMDQISFSIRIVSSIHFFSTTLESYTLSHWWSFFPFTLPKKRRLSWPRRSLTISSWPFHWSFLSFNYALCFLPFPHNKKRIGLISPVTLKFLLPKPGRLLPGCLFCHQTHLLVLTNCLPPFPLHLDIKLRSWVLCSFPIAMSVSLVFFFLVHFLGYVQATLLD